VGAMPPRPLVYRPPKAPFARALPVGGSGELCRVEVEMVAVSFDVSRRRCGWAVEHNGSVLGYTQTRFEAMAIAQDLRCWADQRGRPAEIRIEERRVFASRAPHHH
jgi:hypothetical protein